MKQTFLILIALTALASFQMAAAEQPGERNPEEHPAHLKFYGFIRNYMAFDTRDNKAGTKDLFFYLPKDEEINAQGDDANANPSFRFLALTTRLGLDVQGYQFGRTKMGAKIETDFYCMNGNVAVLRMRQAYATLAWDGLGKDGRQGASLKIGQAWHPMAVDQPYVIDLETGAPFNPFSRTPQAMFDYNFSKHFSLTGGILYQMQYLSTGPSGASDNYLKYSCIPEFYAGVTVKGNTGFLARTGLDILSIKPRWKDDSGSRVSDRLTTVNPYVYAEYREKDFAVNGKFTYGSAGEHINFLSGYGVSAINDDGSYEYAPLHNVEAFISLKYGRRLQIQGMVGYMKNLGTSTDLLTATTIGGEKYADVSYLYLSSNGFANLNRMFRITPTLVYNLGKLSFALEYDMTGAQYGKLVEETYIKVNGLADSGLHWIVNHRLLAMVKFAF